MTPLPQETTSSYSKSPVETDKRIDTLFTRLAAIYGQLWLKAYENEKVLAFAKKDWSESLHRFDNKTLKEALTKFKENKNLSDVLIMYNLLYYSQYAQADIKKKTTAS